jgi:methyl-accepting chemotaxis protein
MKQWLSNRRLWQKIVLIIGTFVLPFGILGFFFLKSFKEDIGIAEYELDGSQVLRPVAQAIAEVSRHGALIKRYSMGEKGLENEIKALQGQIDRSLEAVVGTASNYSGPLELTPEGFKSHGHGDVDFDELRRDWQRLEKDWLTLKPADAEEQQDHLISVLLSLYKHVTDTSTLSLDPLADSYYLMSAAAFRMPYIQTRISEAIRVALPLAEKPDTHEGARLGGLVALIRDGTDLVNNDVKTSVTEAPKGVGKRDTLSQDINPSLLALTHAVNDFTATLSEGVNAQWHDSIVKQGKAADEAGVEFWKTCLDQLDIQIQMRAADKRLHFVKAVSWTAFGLLFSTALTWFIIRHITRTLRVLTETARAAAEEGDLSRQLPPAGRDEIGQLSGAFSAMVQRFRDVTGYAEQLAGGDLSIDVRPLSANDAMGHSLVKMVGNLSTVAKLAEQMAAGDLRLEVTPLSGQDVMGNSLAKMVVNLSALAGHVQKAAIVMNGSVTDIAATAKEQQATTSEVAATTTEIGATSKEIYATSKELLKTVNEVSGVAEETAALANSGQASLARMEDSMGLFTEAVASINSKLAVLNEKAANINQVVTTITKVADQTNLLSLNAAIEAEKAGEYGRGFAVVATEIRRLADQTAVASFDIEQMVKEMQSAVSAGVMGMDKFGEQVRRGVQEVQQVGSQLTQIIQQVQALTPRFSTVHEGMQAQALGADQITQALLQLSEATQQTADSLRQSNVSIEKLHDASRGMLSSLDGFKLRAA